MDASRRWTRELCAAGLEEAAQYAVSMAYRVRFVMQMNAREAMHLTSCDRSRRATRRTGAWRRRCTG